MANLRTGLAQVNCTPRPGLPFMGHFRQDYGAKGVHDPLCARALVIADEAGGKAAMVTIDVCMLTRHQIAMLRGYVSSQCSIPPENILAAATHTHGSIATKSIYGMPKAPDAEVETFLQCAGQAVIEADKKLQPATLEVGNAAEERISFNRRLKCRDGLTHMNWEEIDPATVTNVLGPIDNQVKTLSLRSRKDRSGCLVNFALHPAILDYENNLYTADYNGYLTEAMNEIFGHDFITLFFNGCCGNVNHLNYADKDSPRRGYVMAQRVGYMLAARAAEAMRNAVPVRGDTVAVSREHVTLDRFKIPDSLYRQAKQFLESDRQEQYEQIDGLDLKNSAPMWVQMYEQQNIPDAIEVMVIRAGDAAIVGLPGELFCEHGLAIKRQSPAAHTFVIELANDAAGYFPTREAFDQGGYEITPGATNYERGAGEKLVQSAINQINNLFNGD